MANHKMYRPLAAMLAIFGVGSSVILACSGDDDAAPNDQDSGIDAGPQADTGPVTETPDARPDEYTVDIGAGFATACALSNLGHVKCWGEAAHGDFLTAPAQGKECFSPLSGLTSCDHRPPTDLAIPYPVEQLVVGYENVCVIANDNGTRKLGCWGDTENSARLTSYGPDAGLVTSILWIPLPAEPKRLSGDDFFKIVELTDGTVWGWGDNQFGQYAGKVIKAEVGIPSKVWPVAADAGPDGGEGADAGPILDITTEYKSSFVLTAGGALYGTGDNFLRQQQRTYPRFPDDPDVAQFYVWTKTPAVRNGTDGGALEDAGGDPIAKLFKSNGGAGSGCYITRSGKAYCWGSNESGQIGAPVIATGFNKFAQTPTQIDLPAGRTATQITIAPGEACAIADDSTVYCWGDNTHGAVAQTPPEGLVTSPRLVPGVSDVKAVAVGTLFFACALTGSHKTFCWGDNGYGQRGGEPDGGDSQFSSTPNEVPLTW